MYELTEESPNKLTYEKGYYYASVELNNNKQYIFISDMDKKESIKQVYKFLGVKNRNEYSQLDKNKSTIPIFYKYVGDMSLIGIKPFCESALKSGAEVIYIPFSWEDVKTIHVEIK